MLRSLLIVACASWPAVAVAQPAHLGDGEIRELVSGATVALDTPLGSKLPISYTPDGKVSGEARDLASYLGAVRDTGTWWVASGRLCHQWTRWFDGKVECLTLTRQGRTIHWRNQEGRTGTASVTAPAPARIAAAPSTPVPSAPARTIPEGAMRLQPPQAPPPKAVPDVAFTVPAPSPSNAAAAAEPRTSPPPAVSLPKAPRHAARPDAAAPQGPQHQSTPPGSPWPQQAPTFIVANVNRGDVLNVRTGPSAEHDIVRTLAPGVGGITISGECRAIWCPITLEATSGWVNRRYLDEHGHDGTGGPAEHRRGVAFAARGRDEGPRDTAQAPRGCLTTAARALLDRIEARFGPVQLLSTCRPGATIAGTGRQSRHANGNAIDFDAGSRKTAVVAWLIENHRSGGTMTYPGMDHIHVDIGPHFVSLAGGRRWASWQRNR